MSRVRQRSPQAAQQIALQRTSQMQAAATVLAASDANATSETIGTLGIDGINTTLADFETRIATLESS